MSTLVTHHNGMDRVLRGVEFVIEGLYGAARGNSAGKARARDVAMRQAASALSSASLAAEAKPGFFARLRADHARRRADREFEAMMMADPRMRSEFLAAKARAEWSR